MKKCICTILLIFFICLLAGCKNDEPSQISCKYSEGSGDFSVVVEMLFKRDNKREKVTFGHLKMSYDLGDIKLDDIKNGNIEDEEVANLLSTLFDTVCQNVGSNYSDCDVVETDIGADVIMTFDLTNLAQTSSGSFHRNMSIEQIKEYIQSRSEDMQMVCTTK